MFSNCFSIRRIGFSLLIVLLSGYGLQAQTTGFSGTGANIDVKYHRFEWTINPGAGKAIAGTVTTYFETKVNNVSQITFDFTKSSYNNGSLVVKYHGSTAGVAFSFPTTGNVNILRITLPVTLAINTLDSVSITYAGTPPSFATYGEGVDIKTVTGMGTAVYSLAESYGDDDFWPCKADMQDRIDSVDFIITTPSAYRAAANGKLISDVVSAPNRIMTYKHRYPIPSYLVSIAVAQYTVYNRTPVTIGGTSVPITYYIYSGRTPTAGNLTVMDYCRDQLTAFSSVFGDYPFKDEKYGMYEFGWGGGMEHQTFSAMSWSSLQSWSVIAHELAHQWFGDKVTFATWNHLWLAEGFARYSEALAAELVPAMGQNASSVRGGFKSQANNATNRAYSCYLPDASIVNSNTIWGSTYGTTVYERGAMVVSMLRMLLGDTKFFEACRNYLNDPALAYRSATTDDLRVHMQNAAGGYDLTPFFNSYVYGNGYPMYSTGIGWAKSGTNRITLQVTAQTKSTGSTVAYYYTPIAIRVQGSIAAQDTVIVIYDQNGQLSKAGNGISPATAGNIISFDLSFNPVTVTFDPLNQTLATGSTSPNAVLDVNMVDFVLQQQPGGNKLSLTVSVTDNDLHSILLQRSQNGTDFTDAGYMTEEQGSGQLKKYSFMDATPYLPSTFYRARLVTATDSKYSKVVRADQDLLTSAAVYPNPADKEVMVKWTANTGTAASVSLVGMDGKTVQRYTTDKNFLQLSVAELPVGTYVVLVKQADKTVLNTPLIIRR